MFKHIVTQVNGRLTALSTRLLALVATRLWNPAKRLLVSFIQGFLSAVNLKCLLVQTMSSIKVLLANLITQAQSIKAELTNVLLKVTRPGQLPPTTVHQTSQPAVTAQLLKKGKRAVSTKQAPSRSKGSKTAQTRTAAQSTQDGLKLQGLVKQHLQHANKASKKGK